MKIAVLIGASSESIFAISQAKSLGLRVVAFDENKNAPGLKEADISFVMDIKNPQKIINRLYEHNLTPDLILPVPLGRCLVTTAALIEHFNLEGASFIATDICTDKLKFHKFLGGVLSQNYHKRETILKKVDCFLISDDLDLSKLKYPLIIKPRFGSGSKDVIAVKNLSELEKFLCGKDLKNNDFLAQTLVEGVEYGLDGVVIDGCYKHILLRQKLLTPLPYRQSIGNISAKEIKKISQSLQAIATNLKLKNSLLNADIIITPNSEPFIIEISPRPSGHYLSSTFVQIVTGINMIKEWINLSLKKPFDFEPRFFKHAIIRYFDCEGEVKIPNFNALKNELGIIKYECNINRNLCKVTNGASIMWRGYAIMVADTSQECLENAQILMNEFKL